MRESDQAVWLARLDAELDNLRAALAWAGDQAAGAEAAEAGLRLAGALWRFWGRRAAPARAGPIWSGCSPAAPALLPSAPGGCSRAAYLAWRQDDLAVARARGEAALALARAVGDAPTVLWARLSLGGVALSRGDSAGAEAALAAGQARAAGAPAARAWRLYFLGEAARARGDLPRAARRLRTSLALARARGDHWSAGLVLLGLARVVAARGDPARAAALQRESLACWRALGDAVGVAHSLDELAQVALAGGQTRARRSCSGRLRCCGSAPAARPGPPGPPTAPEPSRPSGAPWGRPLRGGLGRGAGAGARGGADRGGGGSTRCGSRVRETRAEGPGAADAPVGKRRARRRRHSASTAHTQIRWGSSGASTRRLGRMGTEIVRVGQK